MVGSKMLVEYLHAVSVADLRMCGLFVAGEINVLDFSKMSNGTNDIWDGFCFKTDIHDDGYGLLYITVKNENAVQTYEQKISIRPTKPKFGGFRFWLGCPCCGKNRNALYFMGGSLACRKCHGLAYKSQNAIMPVRMLYKAQAIHQHLGGSGYVFDDVPEKPKGMHQRTYDRLVQEFDKNFSVYNQYVQNQVEKFKSIFN